MAEIRSLHGTTVAEIFNDGLGKLDEIEAVAVSVLWKNGAVTAGCSNTDNAKLALMVLALDVHQRRAFEDGD
ncbi:MAG: hypothetical protein O6829_08200 [Alphaproteobacteria bacterium]|jgi:hypothetical protein|nr:hypothetical protein [Alphaproteobacteria bacterium]